MSIQMPLTFQHGHLLATIGNADWLIDTGAPMSFGNQSSLQLVDQEFDVAEGYGGMSAEVVSGYIGHPLAGVIGVDILNEFDVIFDMRNGTLTFSQEVVALAGNTLPLSDITGVPLLDVSIGDAIHQMFFDTGAQVSYFLNDDLQDYPPMGMLRDFFPLFGKFETQTYRLPTQIGTSRFDLRCGSLPELLGMAILMTGASGVIGNETMVDRIVGYFPRRQQLVLA